MAPSDQVPARSTIIPWNAWIADEREAPATPRNANIPPPPPGLLSPNVIEPKPDEPRGEALPAAVDPKKDPGDPKLVPPPKVGGQKKWNLLDDWKNKLLGKNSQAGKIKINQGLDEFDFTYKFRKYLFDEPLKEFYDYLHDEKQNDQAPIASRKQISSQAEMANTPIPEVGGEQEDPASGQLLSPEAQSLKPSSTPSPAQIGQPSQNPPAARDTNTLEAAGYAEHPSEGPAAEKTKLNRFLRRIDLNFQPRSNLAGVTEIITSPDSRYAILQIDYGQVFRFVDLKQPGDRYLGKKEAYNMVNHFEWTQSNFNLHRPLCQEILSKRLLERRHYEDDEAILKNFIEPGQTERDQMHLRKSFVRFFPDSSKIAFLDSDRLQLSIYDVQKVAENGWAGHYSLIQKINLLELQVVQKFATTYDTKDKIKTVFGVRLRNIRESDTKEFVPITFFYFEKLAVKGTTFSSLEHDVLMIGTCYGIIRISFPKTGFFFDPSWEDHNQEIDLARIPIGPDGFRRQVQKCGGQNTARWFEFQERFVEVYSPAHFKGFYSKYMGLKSQDVQPFFNETGIHGYVLKTDGPKGTQKVKAFSVNWSGYHPYLAIADRPKIRIDRRQLAELPELFTKIKIKSRLDMNCFVCADHPLAGEFRMLGYDVRKAEVIKITAKGNETVMKLGHRTDVQSVICKDDSKLLLVVEDTGKATLSMMFNKNYIQLDEFEMQLESPGKKFDITSNAHILDDYSSVLFVNNASLFIYDINLPAPNMRYYLESSDSDMRPFAPIGPHWFMLSARQLLFRMQMLSDSTGKDLKFYDTKFIDFDDKHVQLKSMVTCLPGHLDSEIGLLSRHFDEFLSLIEEQNPSENRSIEDSSDLEALDLHRYPKPVVEFGIANKLLFMDGAVFPDHMEYTTSKRQENSGKSLGNDSGLPLERFKNVMNTQFIPGHPNLQLFSWTCELFRNATLVGLRDISYHQPLNRNGAFMPPTTKWEILLRRTRSDDSFKWDGTDIGSFFKFDPTYSVAALSLTSLEDDLKSVVAILQIATGAILAMIPAELFAQLTSPTTVILAFQAYDMQSAKGAATLAYFKKFLKPTLLKYLMENSGRRPIISYDLLTDQLTELYSIQDYTQQPSDSEPEQQKAYMFYHSHMLPLDIPDPQLAKAEPQEALKLPRTAVLLKPNLIALLRCNDSDPKTAKDPVIKVQKVWEDSSKKLNFNAITKDGSVVFSRGNLWMAYYDESTLDVIRVMWTPTLEFAKFVVKGKEFDQLKISSKGVRSLRLCFSEDGKHLVIKAGKKLTLYELSMPVFLPAKTSGLKLGAAATPAKRPAKVTEISDLEISELASSSNVVSMKFRKGLLDLAYARDYMFYFESLSFDFNPKNLYLKSLRNKLLGFQSAQAGKEQQKVAAEIATIMMEQPIHQKFSDSTYLKILCAFKKTAPLAEYLHLMVKSPYIIFQHNPYREIVEYINGTGATNRVIESLIDFVENCVTKNNELPIYDTDVLLSWLREKKIESNKEPDFDTEGKEINRSLEAIKISIQYRRKLLQLITLAPTQRSILGELKSPESNVTAVSCSYSQKEGFPAAIDQAKKTLMDETSANSITYESFFSAFPFDLTNGSKFSLDYFTWLEDVSDEDLVNKYAGIIYYKWSLVLKPAVIYSLFFWALNGLLCAFMGFSYKTVWLGAITIVLHCLFILYEFKCYLFAFIESIKDPWNYVDIVAHLFSLLSVGMLLHFRNQIDDDPKLFSQLSWLRMISFSLITFRSLGLFRIFSGTRYLIVMIFAVFKEIAIFLSVFGYMIFIYWFVCLIRPSLVPGGSDETFYNAITQSLDIAFSNFNGADLSWIVLVSTVLGQVILGLVLLNYLIAIVSKTHERVSEQRSLYDIRILLSIIKEFDSFFYVKKNDKETIDEKTANTYITVLAEEEQSIQVKKLKEGLRVLEAEQGTSKLMTDLDNVGNKVRKSLFELEKRIDTMGTQLDIEVRNILKNRKIKQTEATKGLPKVMETCKDNIFTKVKAAKLQAQSKGEKSAQEREKLRIQELEAMIAAKEAEKKLKEASHEASRMRNEDSDDDDLHESMDQIDEEDDEAGEEGGEEEQNDEEEPQE